MSEDKDKAAAVALCLPLPEAIARAAPDDSKLAGQYGNVCRYVWQAIEQHENRKKPYEWLEQQKTSTNEFRNLERISAKFQKHSITDLPITIGSSEEAHKWLKGLKKLVRSLGIPVPDLQTPSPPVFDYWLEVTRLQDLAGMANPTSKDSKLPWRDLSIADLAKELPRLESDGECMLFIGRNDIGENNRKSFTPVVAVPLFQTNGDNPAPFEKSDLVVNLTEFYGKDNAEPLYELSDADLQLWQSHALPGEESSPPLPATWPELFGRITATTNAWYDQTDGLAGLGEILRGPSARKLTARLIAMADVNPSPFHRVLKKAKANGPAYPLLQQVLTQIENPTPRSALSLATADRYTFLGHMDSCKDGVRQKAFPLDSTQRLAAMAVSRLPFSETPTIIPINGPPGTGKTSFLRAALASIWVEAALERRPHPCVVYGTAATNQAVSNMIDAFAGIKSSTLDGPAFPWLPDLNSYGWFYPSKEGAATYPNFMQLIYQKQGSPLFGHAYQPAGLAANFREHDLSDLNSSLIANGAAALKIDLEGLTPALLQDRVHDRLKELRHAMNQRQKRADEFKEKAIHAWRNAQRAKFLLIRRKAQLEEATARTKSTQEELENINLAIGCIAVTTKEQRRLERGWRSYFPQAVRRILWGPSLRDLDTLIKRADIYAQSFKFSNLQTLHDRETLLESLCEKAERIAEKLAENIAKKARIEHSISRADGRLALRASTIKALFAETQTGNPLELARLIAKRTRAKHSLQLDESLIHAIDASFDATFRVEMFHWAARYWECQWIIAQERREDLTPAGDVRRLMMLGLIIVATTHKLLSLGEKLKADLLVMDEAGQCLPEVAAACLTLADNAAFVGDILQIKPVADLPENLSRTIEAKVTGGGNLPDEVRTTTGSGMHIARVASRSVTNDEPGVTLYHHYRCVPSIIGYCNELLYKGRIRCARTPQRPAYLDWIPPMGWVGLSGTPERSGQSWINHAEIDAISDWLETNLDRLTNERQEDGSIVTRPLHEVVAIITPLSAQARKIREKIKFLGKDVVAGMVVGTVHKLQGAEKPVVLFSMVQAPPTNPNLMFDRDGGNLANVAVSRARDAFIIFANNNILKVDPVDKTKITKPNQNKPSVKLARYLRAHGQRLFPRCVVVIEAPGKCAAIQRVLGPNVAVIATGGALCQSSLVDCGLAWAEPPQEWLDGLTPHAGFIDELVIATDDDVAGELIGWQAASTAAPILFPSDSKPPRIRRMRFSDMTPETLKTAFTAAGSRFDDAMLAAALVREFANHADPLMQDAAGLPRDARASAQARDAVAWLADNGPALGEETHRSIAVDLTDEAGNTYVGFLPGDRSSTARPALYSEGEANAIKDCLEPDQTLNPTGSTFVMQNPGLYPASTTARVLGVAADDLGFAPQKTQDHLNALYLDGTSTEESGHV